MSGSDSSTSGASGTSSAAAAPEKKKSHGADTEAGWVHTLGGIVGGATGIMVAYPLDTIKVRLQSRPGEYKGMFDCSAKMVRQEGVRSLYRGLSAPVVGYGAINAAVFWAFGTGQAVMRRYRGDGSMDRELTLGETVVVGAWSGTVSSTVRGPVERIKTVMQVRKNPDGTKVYKSSWQCLKGTMRTEGMLSPFRGMGPTVVRESFQYATYFPIFAITKRMLAREGQDLRELDVGQLMIAGGVTGALQWLPPSYCVDVVKSRYQAAEPGVYKGVMDCARKSYRAEGPMVFFRGLTPTLIRGCPLHATILTTYEYFVRFVGPLVAGGSHDE